MYVISDFMVEFKQDQEIKKKKKSEAIAHQRKRFIDFFFIKKKKILYLLLVHFRQVEYSAGVREKGKLISRAPQYIP